MSDIRINDNILKSVRKCIGGEENGDAFDTDLILAINTVFQTLHQLGIGPKEPFSISDGSEEWSDFLDSSSFEACKEYVIIRVRLLFDPPQSSYLVDNLKEELREIEWRLVFENETEWDQL